MSGDLSFVFSRAQFSERSFLCGRLIENHFVLSFDLFIFLFILSNLISRDSTRELSLRHLQLLHCFAISAALSSLEDWV
jgi:hypothetical protein